jgi:cytochrome c oxidase assembly factor CtaG
MDWSFDPGVILWIGVAEGLYLRALRILGRRGVAVPRLQRALWHLGIALWVIGLMSPIDTEGDDLLSAHMAQHLLIADLAAPLLLAGARNPVFGFLLPRSALLTLARRKRLRGAFRTLRRPLVAVPVYALILYGWHLSFAFQAAVEHPVVHALQHASFVGAGLLVWWSALEPKRRRLRGELWKIAHILSARMVGMFLGMGFVFIRHPIYTDVYGAGDRPHGFSALGDQQTAGAMMVTLDILIMAFALCFFFLRAAQEGARRDEADARRHRESVPTST